MAGRRVCWGYVVAAYANDDTRIFSGQDAYVYFNHGKQAWFDFDEATVVNHETALVNLIEEANDSPDTKRFKYLPEPYLAETFISDVSSETLENHILERKKKRALAKLTEEDMRVLGLKQTKGAL